MSEPTIVMRRDADGTFHSVLVRAVDWARTKGFSIIDPDEYKAKRYAMRQLPVEGEVVKPMSAGEFDSSGPGPTFGAEPPDPKTAPGSAEIFLVYPTPKPRPRAARKTSVRMLRGI